jgi:hypothetical protein
VFGKDTSSENEVQDDTKGILNSEICFPPTMTLEVSFVFSCYFTAMPLPTQCAYHYFGLLFSAQN